MHACVTVVDDKLECHSQEHWPFLFRLGLSSAWSLSIRQDWPASELHGNPALDYICVPLCPAFFFKPTEFGTFGFKEHEEACKVIKHYLPASRRLYALDPLVIGKVSFSTDDKH